MTSAEAKNPQDNWTFGDWMESRVVILNDNKELLEKVAQLVSLVRTAYGEGQGSVGWSGSTPFKDSSVAFELSQLE